MGVAISTLPDAGWFVMVDLEGTSLDGKEFVELDHYQGEADWIHCRVTEKRLECSGDAGKLGEILEIFRGWATGGAAPRRYSITPQPN